MNFRWIRILGWRSRRTFEFIGKVKEEEFKATIRGVFSGGAHCKTILVIGANEYKEDPSGGGQILEHFAHLNSWTAEISQEFDNTVLVNIRDFVEDEREVHTYDHFDRQVYHRLFEWIRDALAKGDVTASNA